MPKPNSPLPVERFPAHPQSAGLERGDSRGSSQAVAALDSFIYRDMRWCDVCEQMEEVRDLLEFADRRVSVCMGCGTVRTRWTRTTEVCA